ncbi:MAG: molybdopterin molybdotransferase MoeA [Oscillospiraceae bacterium]|nr:molybdopterin molybdotransferase MoeA [Oscillospiraceae bacterium]
MLRNLDTDVACRLLFEQEAAHQTEAVRLGDALLRISAQSVYAKIPIPPFDRSPYDGYAFRGEDTQGAVSGAPAVLSIIEEIPAGTEPRYKIAPGQAAKILTGAPIPKGANATIKYESTKFTSDNVRIFEEVAPNTDIVYAGADVMPGNTLASKGSIITAPIISAFANQGFGSVEVFAKPVISVISTGSELCEIGEALRPSAIYNSNAHTISAYLSDVGAVAVNCGSIPDEPELISERIRSALDKSDMVITTGGASVGDYDWAVDATRKLGAKILFWKASMRPGGSILAAVCDGKLILGLSGNPAAAVIGLLRIGMPYIKKLCGRADCFFPEISVALRDALGKDSPKMRILRGFLEVENGVAYFAQSGSQGSEAVSSLAKCDLLGEIPPGSPPLPAGAIIKAYRI